MEPRDPLMTELEAMAVISRVLETLSDSATRQRLLRWAAERAGVEAVAFSKGLEVTTTSPVRAADDPALKLDSLEDMFDTAAPIEDDLTVVVDEPIASLPVPPETSKAPVADVLRSFAAEFQRFAEEWNGAAA
jgi:hypothetical protein